MVNATTILIVGNILVIPRDDVDQDYNKYNKISSKGVNSSNKIVC